MDEAWKKIIQTTNKSKAPLIDEVVTHLLLDLFYKTRNPRLLEALEAAYLPTSMEIIVDDKELYKLIPHLPLIEKIKYTGAEPMKLQACNAVAFEDTLNTTSRKRRILLLQSAIWYVIRHTSP
jgi:hypothetical protein